MQRKSPKRAEKIVRRVLADGTVKEYRYLKKKQRRLGAIPKGETLLDLLNAYRASPKWKELQQNTRTVYGIYHKPFDKIGFLRARDITYKHVRTLRDAIAEARGHGAAIGFVRAAKALFSWAVENDWLTISPIVGMKSDRGEPLPTWTEDVYQRAITELPEAYRRVIILAVYTGQRRADLITLRWSDCRDGRIVLTQQKTREAIDIPIHPELAIELAAWRGDAKDDDLILKGPRGQPWTAQHLSREMTKAIEAFGLGRFTLHGLRKLAAVRLALAGATSKEMMAVMGWRSISMAQLYTREAEKAELSDAAFDKLKRRRIKAISK